MDSRKSLTYLSFFSIGNKNQTDVCIQTIEKDLDRLEKLEKAIDILKEVLKNELVLNLGENIVYISKINHNNSIVYIGKEECELLKEVLKND